MNKGQTQVSYNWLFVLIGGAALFSFLIFLVASEQDATENRNNIETLNNVYNELNLRLEERTQQTERINGNQQTYTFSCDEAGQTIHLKGTSAERSLPTQPIFATTLNGDIITQKLTLSLPHRLTSFLIASDTATTYHFLGDQLTPLYNEMPSSFNKKQTTPDEAVGLDQTDVVITPTDINTDATTIHVKQTKQTEVNTQTINHYNVTLQDTTYTLPGESLTLAALTTQNASLFSCGLDKIRTRSNQTLIVDEQRIRSIKERINTDETLTRCQGRYEQNSRPVEDILTTYQTRIKDVGKTTRFIDDIVTPLIQINADLRRNSCPQIV